LEITPFITQNTNPFFNNEKGEMQQIEINLEKSEDKQKEILNPENNLINKSVSFNNNNIFTRRKRTRSKFRTTTSNQIGLNMNIPLSKKNMFHVERNPSEKRFVQEIQIPTNEIKNIEIKKEEIPNVSDLNTKIIQNVEIKKETETDESKIRDNKLELILAKGEYLLNIINSKKLENEGTQKINSLQDIIEVRKKEIELAKINLEKIMLYNQKLKSYNKEEVEEIINKIKDNYKEYKNKIEILKLFGKILNKPEIDEDAKSLMINYKTIYSKCQALLTKILLGLSRVLKECINIEEFVQVLSNNEGIDLTKIDFLLSSEDMDRNVEYLRNIFKSELNGVFKNLNLTIEDNMKINSISNTESNLNMNSNSNLNSCSNNNFNFPSENIPTNDVNNEINNNNSTNNDVNNNEVKNEMNIIETHNEVSKIEIHNDENKIETHNEENNNETHNEVNNNETHNEMNNNETHNEMNNNETHNEMDIIETHNEMNNNETHNEVNNDANNGIKHEMSIIIKNVINDALNNNSIDDMNNDANINNIQNLVKKNQESNNVNLSSNNIDSALEKKLKKKDIKLKKIHEREQLEKFIIERTKNFVKEVNHEYSNRNNKYYGSINKNNSQIFPEKNRNIDLYDDLDNINQKEDLNINSIRSSFKEQIIENSQYSFSQKYQNLTITQIQGTKTEKKPKSK